MSNIKILYFGIYSFEEDDDKYCRWKVKEQNPTKERARCEFILVLHKVEALDFQL